MKNFCSLSFIVILSLLSFSVSAQPADSLLSELSQKWSNAEKYTLQLASSMPEEHYGFKPAAEEKTFKEQLLHVAQNMLWLSTAYLFAPQQPPAKPGENLSKEEVLSQLAKAYQLALAAQVNLKPEQLNQVVPFFSGPKTRRQIINLMHDHQTHHLGQLIVYIRMKGIAPPAYVGW